MRRIRFAAAASDELSEGAAWYEAQRPGLGDEFIAAVRATLDRVRENLVPLTPILGECGEANAGKMTVHRFPYNVVVIDEPEGRIVVAIAHQSRKPDYWQVRWPPDSATPN